MFVFQRKDFNYLYYLSVKKYKCILASLQNNSMWRVFSLGGLCIIYMEHSTVSTQKAPQQAIYAGVVRVKHLYHYTENWELSWCQLYCQRCVVNMGKLQSNQCRVRALWQLPFFSDQAPVTVTLLIYSGKFDTQGFIKWIGHHHTHTWQREIDLFSSTVFLDINDFENHRLTRSLHQNVQFRSVTLDKCQMKSRHYLNQCRSVFS